MKISKGICAHRDIRHHELRGGSKKSIQQGRSHFCARSVLVLCEHGKMTRTPLVAFFNSPLLKGRQGSALIAALVLVAISGIMGATILFATSTDLQISGNYRRAIQTFYAAEAGLAETQRRLSGTPASNPLVLGDLALPYQSNWSAYVFSHDGWQPEDDQAYDALLTNYIPLSGNAANTLIQANSVQSKLVYWTKAYHKREYDAEQAGHRKTTPHYVDGDGETALHSISNKGELVRYGYPSGLSVTPQQFTTIEPTLYPPVEVILSHGQVEGAEAILQADVIHPTGPPVWAPVYVGKEVVMSGSRVTIEGMDTCGLFPSGLSPISLAPLASLVGVASLNGNPVSPQMSPASLELEEQIDELKRGATPVLADLTGANMGSAASSMLLYAEPINGPLVVSQVTGYGILLVKGNIQIDAPFHWDGVVIVSGQATFSGGIGPSILNGAIYANQVHILHDDVTITLDTCPITATLRTLPVQVLTWRQLL